MGHLRAEAMKRSLEATCSVSSATGKTRQPRSIGLGLGEKGQKAKAPRCQGLLVTAAEPSVS